MLFAAFYSAADFFLSGWVLYQFFDWAYPTVCECYYWGSRFSFNQGPGSGNPNARVYFSSCDESSMMLNSCIYKNGTVVYNKTCTAQWRLKLVYILQF